MSRGAGLLHRPGHRRRPAMARANAASAGVRGHAIGGLARSVARPAYQRLLEAEPFLRRVVPALIVTFLVVIASGPWCRSMATAVGSRQRQGRSLPARSGDGRRPVPAARRQCCEGPVGACRFAAAARHAGGTPRLCDGSCRTRDRHRPAGRPHAHEPLQIIDPSQPLTVFAERAGVLEISIKDQPYLATVRNLTPPLGQIVYIQPLNRALTAWSDTRR